MTDQTQENMDDEQRKREQQQHKGYGEDEGEREGALPQEEEQE